MSFPSTGLSPWLCRTCDGLGMRSPTAVQLAAVPLILQHKQVCASASTGSGKTAAFLLPILHHLAADPYGVYALILTPSRELAQQIAACVRTFGGAVNARWALLVGGCGYQSQHRAVERRPHIVVGTPGRVYDILEGPNCSALFKKLRYLVLDEADMLLEDEFYDQIERILPFLPPSPRRITLFFSATITDLVKERIPLITAEPVEHLTMEGMSLLPPTLDERVLWIPLVLFYPHLYYLLDPAVLPAKSVIIFTMSRNKTEMVKLTLAELGCSVTSISSSQAQKVRFRNLARFRSGKARVLVATDLASRGLDLPTVDLVINFDLPFTPQDYLHRVGRTARAGKGGIAVTFLLNEEKSMIRLNRIGDFTHGHFVEFRPDEDEVAKHLSTVTAARLRAERRYEELYGEAQDKEKRFLEVTKLTAGTNADGTPRASSPERQRKEKRRRLEQLRAKATAGP